MDLASFIQKWRHASSGSERANKDLFLTELCDILDVPRPDPKTGDRAKDRYVFEADVLSVHEGGKVTTLKADLYKRGCFILEAKQGSEAGDAKVGSARRDTPQWQKMMQEAQGQAIGYARSMDDPPPFIVTCDIGYVFELYADFDRSGYYRPFPNAQRNRLFLADLARHKDTLRALFLDPRSLDPSQATVKVTRRVAERLAEVAKYLEKDGHAPEAIAKFLMRCLFTMFAEDVDLLPDHLFTKALEEHWMPRPEKFKVGIETLWRAMNDGAPFGFAGQLLRFNGGLFVDPSALPVGPDGLKLLLDAAKCDWSDVEPAIFGTLLERALNEKERHALGAHFTPRAYVERLVRPTIEEPLRTEWENVQTAAHKLNADGKVQAAKDAVHAFHQKLCQTRVLDPACGSGNFLYVTLNIFKQIESEVLALLADLGEKQEQLIRVTPKQFLGIEVKPWAKEIAELVLWIGYLQWHYRTHGKRVPPPQPVLQDFQNIERRDAVLAWDSVELVRDEKGKPVTRWDGETYKRNPVTREMVPDEKAQVAVEQYVNPRKAEWPKADYVVGNPPFVGSKRLRAALGDGYTDALRAAHADVPNSADFVLYWWKHASDMVAAGLAKRFGLITTNSITSTFNRRVVADALHRGNIQIVFAIPDHPWVDTASAADVRIAMTVCQRGSGVGVVESLSSEEDSAEDDGASGLSFVRRTGSINDELTVATSTSELVQLAANCGLASMGVQLYGSGFILEPSDATSIGQARNPQTNAGIVRPFVNGRDLVARPRKVFAIDFFGLSEQKARDLLPAAYQHVLAHVKPERDQNRRDTIKKIWWRFGWERPVWRAAAAGLERYMATCRTAKHRVFVFLDREILAESKIVVIAAADAWLLGTLSSRLHTVFAERVGAWLGVGNDSTYNHADCFNKFPFPNANPAQQQCIRGLGEQLDAHRKARQAAHPDLTITGMYNVLEKIRAGAELTDKDRDVHERGLVSILKKIHDDLDVAVFDAYGWTADLTDEQILEKLVALNAERAEEEKKGYVRWLRPDFQNPTGRKPETQEALLPTGEEHAAELPAPESVRPWPKKIAEQIAAVRDRVSAPGKVFSVEGVAAAFKGAKKKDVEGFLDGFAALGVLTAFDTPAGKRWRAVGKVG